MTKATLTIKNINTGEYTLTSGDPGKLLVELPPLQNEIKSTRHDAMLDLLLDGRTLTASMTPRFTISMPGRTVFEIVEFILGRLHEFKPIYDAKAEPITLEANQVLSAVIGELLK